MQEVKSKILSAVDKLKNKEVTLYLSSKLYRLSGDWQWEGQSDAVFCSDVLVSLPSDFRGTRGIFYPDDVTAVKDGLQTISELKSGFLQFRIITSYGEVKTIVGKNVQVIDGPAEEGDFFSEALQKELHLIELEKQLEEFSLKKDISDYADRLHKIGVWFFNTNTYQVWFSDNLYRICGVPPQSLNPHLYTFLPFVHPDEKDIVQDAFERSMHNKVPLHIEFRLITPDKKIKWLLFSTQWLYNAKGEEVLSGVISDETDNKALLQQLEGWEWEALFQKSLVRMDEKVASIGHWYVNMATRKVYFSETCFRLHGLKGKSETAGFDTFINFVHSDDRAIVEEACKKIFKEKLLPEISFRIIRQDGKIRHMRMNGHLFNSSGEEVVIGFMQDVSVQVMSEQKMRELKETFSLQSFATAQAESVAHFGSWLWNLKTHKINFSEGFFDLFGHVSNDEDKVQKQLIKLVHQEDRDQFGIYLNDLLQQQKEAEFEFRLVRSGAIRQFKAFYKIASFDDKSFFIATFQDITGEVNLRRQLTERIQLSEIITENILDRAVITDANNTIVLWNRKCEEVYKIKKDAALGKNIFDVFPQLKNEEDLSLFHRALNGEPIFKAHEKGLVSDEFHDLHMIPLKNEADEVFGIIHLLHDVTREAELQQHLNDRVRFIENLLDATVDRIVVLDRLMNYTYWNKRAEQFYGIPKNEVIGKNILELFPNFFTDSIYESFRRALKGEIVYISAEQNLQEKKGYYETYLIPLKNEREEVSGMLWIVHDLTAEFRLQEERMNTVMLQQEHRRLKEAQAIGRVGSFEWNINNGKIVWSDEMYRIHGLEPQSETITLDKVYSLIYPDDLPELKRNIEHIYLQAGSFDLIHRIVTANGEVCYVRRVAKSFPDDSGEILHISGTVQDINEMVLSELELKKNQNLLKTTIDSSLEMIQVFEAVRNNKGEIIDFKWILNNEVSEKIYGNVIGKSLLKHNPGVIEAGIFDIFKRVVETGIPDKSEHNYRYEQFNGWFYQSTVKLNDGVATTTRDITERKKAETDLLLLKDEVAKKATDKYHSLFNSIDEGFSIIELIFDEKDKLVDFIYLENNPAFVKQVGMQLEGKRRSELFFEKKDFLLEKYEHLAKTGEPLHFEYSMENLGGQWFQVTATRIGGEDGRNLGVIFRNITERKKLEQRQEYVIKLNDALRSLSNPLEIQRAAMRVIGEHFQVDRVLYSTITPDGEMWVTQDNYTSGRLPKLVGSFPTAAFGASVEPLSRGEVVVYPDIDKAAHLTKAERQLYEEFDTRSALGVPLFKDNRWIANIGIHHREPREWTAEEIELVRETAERTWDAVERAKAEEALQESERQLSAVFKALPVAFGLVDLDGKLLMANKEMYYYLPTNAIQSTDDTIIDHWIGYDADGNVVEKSNWPTASALRGETVMPGMEMLYTDAQGQQKWVRVSSVPFRNEKGEVIGATSAIVDITELKELTRVLEERIADRTKIIKENSDLLESVFQNTSSSIMLLKPLRNEQSQVIDFEYVLTNSHTLQSVNRTSLKGKKMTEEFPGVLKLELFKQYIAVVETGIELNEQVHVDIDEFDVWADVHACCVNEYLLVTYTDITHQKRTEKDLQKNKELLQSVFDASLQGIILFKAVRTETGAIKDYQVVLNNTVTQSWNQKDLTGKYYIEEFPNVHKTAIIDTYNQVMETGAPAKLEVKYEGNGFNNWYNITAVKLNDEELVTTAEDITERKNAEEELKKHYTILQHTEELAQTGSWEYNIQTGQIDWSDGMYALFGLPKGVRVTPQTYLDFVIEEDRIKAKSIVNNFKKKHHPFEETLRIKIETGVRLIRIKASLVHNEEGKAEKLIGVDLDITDIEEAKEKLNETQQWLQQTAIAAPDSITVYDLIQKQPIYLNDCLANWLHISSKELIEIGSKGRLELVHHDDRLKLLHLNEKVAATKDGEILTIDYRLHSKDGKEIWIRNRSKVFLRDDNGKATHTISFLQDISEEVYLSRQLQERTRFAETVLDNSINAMYVLDKDLNILAWNKRCEEEYHLRKEDVIGKDLLQLFPKLVEATEMMDAIKKAFKGELVHINKWQEVYGYNYLELFYVPLRNEHNVVDSILFIGHNISKAVLAEEELKELNTTLEQKNKELEERNEEITHFAFVASHDLKEPLRKIHTYSDWLYSREEEWLSGTAKNYVSKITAAARRLELLIEDILVLTKIHTDKQKTQNVDVNKILERVKEELMPQIEASDAEIIAEKLPVLNANANQIFYLFANLISNAIKFQKPGNKPVVNIATEIIEGEYLKEKEAKPGRDYVKISIADNGLGFDKKYAKKIFQVFQRLHAKHEFEGTGMGLAICKTIMENHEGFITVTSEEGKGAQFCCYFPL